MTIQGRENIKAAYRDNSLADSYIKARFEDPFGAELHLLQVRRLNQAIRRAKPASLLEIACGPARLTAELAYVEHSIAIEQSPAMLSQARRRLEQLDRTHWTVIEGDAFDLPFPDHSFDMVVTARFLRHFNGADRQRLLSGIRRVLRPGGRLVFDVAHASVYEWILAKWGVAGSWVDDYWFEKEEFLAEMQREGFDVDEMYPVHSLARFQYYLYAYGYRVMPGLTSRISRLVTSVCSANAYEWVAVCRLE
jgi:ubiquinone/menaquinone biosynthesis C-methylase UbiE